MHATEFLINPNLITVCGFSAGGHLATLAAGMQTCEYNHEIIEICKPNFIIVGYPITIPSLYLKMRGERLYKFGKMLHIKSAIDTSRDATTYLSEKYPPVFIWHTSQDDLVDSIQSLKFVELLIKNNIQVEYHLFSEGVHGLSTNSNLSNNAYVLNGGIDPVNVSSWVELSIKWLGKKQQELV